MGKMLVAVFDSEAKATLKKRPIFDGDRRAHFARRDLRFRIASFGALPVVSRGLAAPSCPYGRTCTSNSPRLM
jgi:hypothetical protein